MAKLSLVPTLLLFTTLGSSTVCPPRWSLNFKVPSGNVQKSKPTGLRARSAEHGYNKTENAILLATFTTGLPDLGLDGHHEAGGFRMELSADITGGIATPAIFYGPHQLPETKNLTYDPTEWQSIAITTVSGKDHFGKLKHAPDGYKVDMGLYYKDGKNVPFAGKHQTNNTNKADPFSQIAIGGQPTTSLDLMTIWNGTHDLNAPGITFSAVLLFKEPVSSLTEIVKLQDATVSGVSTLKSGIEKNRRWMIQNITFHGMTCAGSS